MTVFHEGRPKYGKVLERLLDKLGVKQVLTLLYNIDNKGKVQIDVMTRHRGIFSFSYEYGNLEYSQDRWDGKTDDEIMLDMINEAARFKTLRDYHVWRMIQLMDQ